MTTLELVVNSAEAPGKYLISLDGDRLVYNSLREGEEKLFHQKIAQTYGLKDILGGGNVSASEGKIMLIGYSRMYGYIPPAIVRPFASPLAKAYRPMTGTETPEIILSINDYGIREKLALTPQEPLEKEFVLRMFRMI